MSDPELPAYFRYWGKAQPSSAASARVHLLPYHCLDVAACGRELLRTRQVSVDRLSEELGWDQSVVHEICIRLLAIHDVGKFSRSFQKLASDIGPAALVSTEKQPRESHRHDTLGWVVCEHLLYSSPDADPFGYAVQMLAEALRIVSGHHGKPPEENDHRGQVERISVDRCFLQDDIETAERFVRDISALLPQPPVPPVAAQHLETLRRHSFRLAGFAVLADWLGSNSESFPYCAQPMPLAEYWEKHALPRAHRAVASAGMMPQAARPRTRARMLLPHLRKQTPLQRYASAVKFGPGPQFFLLEDVTGAGKTEAALLLCHRLMAAGRARGFYFALPTMATANQMYERVGSVYRRMFAEEASPSLVLAHGARELVQGFRDSVLTTNPAAYEVEDDLTPPGVLCNAWIADSRKRALLADAGVGTVDQALLGVLPVRHQGLRLLGLAEKVLVVDEVHAYDSYTSRLLQALVQTQAAAGGSVVLLSATVPASLRERLVQAFCRGSQGEADVTVPADARYPLATHVQGRSIATHACATRAEVRREVRVTFVHSEADAEAQVLEWQREGRAVCWIRNTVHDARRTFLQLRDSVPEGCLQLFHSRFAMGDRLRIEAGALGHFDSRSGAAERSGQVLVATQVVEQSLDVDFDEMIVDLCPIDLVIQRTGRLHRHVRAGDGSRSGQSGRPAPVLYVLAPEFTDHPKPEWYKALFPKASFVYPDHGRLWLTQQALLASGVITAPGEAGQQGGVRGLVEAVYGGTSDPDDDGHLAGEGSPVIPAGLQRSSNQAEGQQRSETSLAEYNLIRMDQGYCFASGDWNAEVRTPTRLGDEARPVYLAREVDGRLQPLVSAARHPWEHSSVRTDMQRIEGLAPAWQARFGSELTRLHNAVPLLAPDAGSLLLPMMEDGEGWIGHVQSGGKSQAVRYSSTLGLELVGEPER